MPDIKKFKMTVRTQITYAALVKYDLTVLYVLMKGQSWQREVNLIPAQIEETVRAKQS